MRFKSNKFAIPVSESSKRAPLSSVHDTESKEYQQNITEMDNIYKYLQNTDGISKEEVDRFVQFIQSEHFDTESLFDDVEDGDNSSNISLQSKSTMVMTTIREYIKYKNGMNAYVAIIIEIFTFLLVYSDCLFIFFRLFLYLLA